MGRLLIAIKIYDWLQNPPFKFYKWLAIGAGILMLLTSLFFHFFKWSYPWNNWDTIMVTDDYSMPYYVFEIGQAMGGLLVWVVAKRLVSSDAVAAILLTWFMDMAATDLYFVMTECPYTISGTKEYAMLICLGIFIIHCSLFNKRHFKNLFITKLK